MKFKQQLRKLHKWIGVFASLWLLLLASTGLLLQHSDDFDLDKSYISSASILKHYGVGKQVKIFEDKNNNLIQIDKSLVLNKELIHFPEKIIKASFQDPYWIIKTQEAQIWLNQRGQIVQTFDQNDQENETEIRWLKPTNNPILSKKAILLSSKRFLSYEQFIFDIHAGITTSKLLNDVAAISLIVLALSGLYLFFRKRRNQPSSR